MPLPTLAFSKSSRIFWRAWSFLTRSSSSSCQLFMRAKVRSLSAMIRFFQIYRTLSLKSEVFCWRLRFQMFRAFITWVEFYWVAWPILIQDCRRDSVTRSLVESLTCSALSCVANLNSACRSSNSVLEHIFTSFKSTDSSQIPHPSSCAWSSLLILSFNFVLSLNTSCSEQLAISFLTILSQTVLTLLFASTPPCIYLQQLKGPCPFLLTDQKATPSTSTPSISRVTFLAENSTRQTALGNLTTFQPGQTRVLRPIPPFLSSPFLMTSIHWLGQDQTQMLRRNSPANSKRRTMVTVNGAMLLGKRKKPPNSAPSIPAQPILLTVNIPISQL